jgi:ERCC4-related helicase
MIRHEDLLDRIGPNIHYLEDLDADKKPTKETETVEVIMSGEQVKLYKQAMKGVDPKIQAMIAAGQAVDQKEAMGIFARLMKARQVSNSLHTVDPKMTPAMAAELTPKIKKVLDDADEHIKSTPDAQIIMFTNVVHGGVDVLTAGLDKRGVNYGVFSGKGNKGVTEKTRQKAVKDYQDGKNKVIVITGAGAEGLSLGNTTMVQMVDGHYNPERMNQAEARGVRAKGLSHRPKEERKVIARRYVSTMPKSFWQTITLRPPEKSVGQWVHTTAGRKEHVTKQMRHVMARRSEHERKRRKSTMYKIFGGGP